MATRENAGDRGRRHGRRIQAKLASELRDARLMAGLSQEHVARAAGLPQSRISRTERDVPPSPRIDEAAAHAAALGLRFWAQTFPEGPAVRDAGQLRLLQRLRDVISAAFTWRSEVSLGISGDLRAWDVRLDGPAIVAIDAETRLHDVQELQRRLELKLRDSGVPCLVLVVAATRHNAAVLRLHRAALTSTFPLGTRETLGALRAGRAPNAYGIAVL